MEQDHADNRYGSQPVKRFDPPFVFLLGGFMAF